MKTLLIAALVVLATARPQGKSDEVTVRFRSLTRADGNSLPDRLTLTLEHNRRDLDLPSTLDLLKNEKISLMEFEIDGELEEADFQDVAFYQDHANHAVITAELIQHAGKPVRTLRGSFVMHGVNYEIEPTVPDPDPTEEDRRDIDPDFDGHDHVVRQVSDVTAQISTMVPEIADLDAANISSRAASTYDVEMYWIADYQMYKEWKKIPGHDSVSKLKKYFAHQANGVDLVYTSFSRIGMKVNVWVLKVEINTSFKSLPTENSKIRGKTNDQNQDRQSIDASKVLEKMGTLRKDRGWSWSKPDHLMLWSGYDLDGSTVGLAYLCGVCSGGMGVSTIEGLTWRAWAVAAHELGHNIGMMHDGQNGCPDRGNIMNPTVVKLDKVASVAETYKFSTCALNNAKACMAGTDDTKFPRICLQSGTCNKEFDTKVSLPDGIDSLDAQCQEQFGLTSETAEGCGSKTPGAETCLKLVCKKGNMCWTGSASDGSPCGTNKWCIEAKCVSKSQKPTTVYKTCNKGSGLPKPGPSCKDTDSQCPGVASAPGLNCPKSYFKNACCNTCTTLGF